MAKKRWGGIVFSTDRDYMDRLAEEERASAELETLAPEKQRLQVRKERKGRGGKVATIVQGFVGNSGDLEALAKRLKVACGVGGSAKEGEIIIQGDRVAQVQELLVSWGYGK